MIFVQGTSAMFPLNLRDIPVIGVSVHVERVGGVGPSLACDHLSWIVAPHYTPRLSHINVVFAWLKCMRISHQHCDLTVPVGRAVAWTGSAGRLETQLIQNWEFLYHGHDDTRIITREQFHDHNVTRLDENDADSKTMLVLSTIPMSCECPKMVEVMTKWAATVTEEQMSQYHLK